MQDVYSETVGPPGLLVDIHVRPDLENHRATSLVVAQARVLCYFLFLWAWFEPQHGVAFPGARELACLLSSRGLAARAKWRTIPRRISWIDGLR